MTPQTVNAYYNPTDNTINFPAAILQPPFFDAKADDAINYGGIGAVIGHEATHGYDDQGSQFDAKGNNANWWTKEDREKFDARTDKLVKQFDAYEPLPGKHVNGKLTLGENIADLGGLNVAYDALQVASEEASRPTTRTIDGYTPDQRFFLELRARLARQHPAAAPGSAAQCRSARAGEIPRDRGAVEHAGVRARRSSARRAMRWFAKATSR